MESTPDNSNKAKPKFMEAMNHPYCLSSKFSNFSAPIMPPAAHKGGQANTIDVFIFEAIL